MKAIRSKVSKRLGVCALVAAILCMMIPAVASAKTFNNRTWYQSLGRTVIDIEQMTPGTNINTSGVKFYCVATSPSDGTFDVVLQRKGFMGIWQNVGGKYTGEQSSKTHFDPRNGVNVQGSVNFMIWSTNQSGEYRVILENATAPQETVLSHIEAWTS